jgi:hypothetical protein
LEAGQSLYVNQELRSPNTLYSLILQWDGNLVLSSVTAGQWYAHWASNTSTADTALRPVRATMQADGNFVLYTASGQAVWDFGRGPGWKKSAPVPNSRLVLQNDRNLVIYDPYWRSVWDAGTTSPDFNYYAEGITRSSPLHRSQGVHITLSAPYAFAEVMDFTIVLYGGKGFNLQSAHGRCYGCHDIEVVHTEYGFRRTPPKETVGFSGYIASAGYRRDIVDTAALPV